METINGDIFEDFVCDLLIGPLKHGSRMPVPSFPKDLPESNVFHLRQCQSSEAVFQSSLITFYLEEFIEGARERLR